MTEITDSSVLDEITNHYLESSDFNGIPAITLCDNLGTNWEGLHEILTILIKQEHINVIYSDVEINTHIIRTGFEPKENQISKLPNGDIYHTCLYPSPAHLEVVVKPEKYAGKPYVLALALGSPQLAYRSFDLSVLEFYRNDPRYYYENDDVNGFISTRDEYYQSNQMNESDKIILQTFGFSYDEDLHRAVAVFVRYLANLSSEHQQIWKAKEIEGNYRLHPDYYRNTINGDWGEGDSIFSAFIIEIYIINQMSKAMGRPPLFRFDYGEYGEDRPKNFGFLVRPTLEEYNSFVLLVDKMVSDNINIKFFQEEIPYEIEIPRKDGKITIQKKGTLQILDEWIRKHFRTEDWGPWDESIAAFKEVRKLRQKPAHSINENVFDQKYFKQQRELIIRVYAATRVLRMMLQNHRLVKKADIFIPDWIEEGKIWTR
jgi:hypothetical protein